MRIVVIGVGHVGLVTALTLCRLGHDVVGLDDDVAKIADLRHGRLPFYEEGLDRLFEEGCTSGRLQFSEYPSEAIPGAEVAFISVGTPGRPTGEPNLVAVENAADLVGKWATRDMVVVEKSTVPVQTAERIQMMLGRRSAHHFAVASNPEFLREGCAVEDSLGPNRILVGTDSREAHEIMRRIYRPMIELGARYFATDAATAELAKHACNAFLALKVSFVNALGRVCEAAGGDVVAVADIMGADPRIGREFLDAGVGFGGSCFPKDLAAFRAQSLRLGYRFGLLDEVVRINDEAVGWVVEKVRAALWNLEEKRVVLLGLTFKPGTDDTRESPGLRVARSLVEAGARVTGCDPKASPDQLEGMEDLAVTSDPYAAAVGAHCLVVCTEWPEYAALDLARLRDLMAFPIIVDGRNVLDPAAVAEAGFTYLPTGRPARGVER